MKVILYRRGLVDSLINVLFLILALKEGLWKFNYYIYRGSASVHTKFDLELEKYAFKTRYLTRQMYIH